MRMLWMETYPWHSERWLALAMLGQLGRRRPVVSRPRSFRVLGGCVAEPSRFVPKPLQLCTIAEVSEHQHAAQGADGRDSWTCTPARAYPAGPREQYGEGDPKGRCERRSGSGRDSRTHQRTCGRSWNPFVRSPPRAAASSEVDLIARWRPAGGWQADDRAPRELP